MEATFSEMDAIFKRTKVAMTEFMGIITPIIENSTDDHERLYWHHIFEEEEHRSDRLDILMPKIQESMNDGGQKMSGNQLESAHLLQDISLEKFGLHNFLEHLDLSLFVFNSTEFEGKIREMRDLTFADYQEMKVILEKLNQEYHGGIELSTSVPTDEKDGHGSNVKIDRYSHGGSPGHEHSAGGSNGHGHGDSHEGSPLQTQRPRKGLTVGSLKNTI